tara:strand:- start:17625 stop:18191 length:567 start_codon:yes stop_codon:yes gene_type:complete
MLKHSSFKVNAAVPCLIDIWHLSESEIYFWILKQTSDKELSFDLLQDTFLKALQHKELFCDIQNQRAWLYKVARNILIDNQRKSKIKHLLDISEHEPSWEEPQSAPIDSLAQCLPKALDKLSQIDKDIISHCDLQGCSQQDYADKNQLTLVATKSRIQRARTKLKNILLKQCHIRFDEHQHVCCFFKE